MVGRAVLVRGPSHGGAFCVGAHRPRCWCVVWWCLAWVVVVCWVAVAVVVVLFASPGLLLCWCVAPPLFGRAVFVSGPPPWWGVQCQRVRVSVRGVVAGSMPGLFCWFAVVSAAVRPALSGVGCLWCLSGRGWCCAPACPPPPLLGRAVFVRAPPHCGAGFVGVCPPHGRACCVGVWPSSWWGVLCWCVAPLVVGRAVLVPACRRGGAWFGLVVFGLGCRRLLGGLRLRFFCLIGRGWCCAGACPPPPVEACRVCAWPPLVGHAVSACFSFGSWCCSRLNARLVLLVRRCLCRRTAGVVRCSLSVVFAWPGLVSAGACPPHPLLGPAVLVRGPPGGGACFVGVCYPHGGACGVGLWPPSWWGVLCWCVSALLVGRAVLVPARRGGGGWLGLSSSVWRVPVAVVLFAWPGSVVLWCVVPPCWGVPCLCVAPPLVGRVVSACLGFGSWCCSQLDARLLLLVRCCLRCRTAGVVGCWLSVVFAWPERTGRPPEHVWCATPCFCFAGVVALPLVFPCSPSAFSCLRSSRPCAGVCCCLLLLPPQPGPPHPTPPL